MSQLIVISALGTDRSGVVDNISKVILDCGGNIEESRMTALGKEFAMLMLVSGNWHTLNKLEAGLDRLTNGTDLTVTIKKTDLRSDNGECMPYAWKNALPVTGRGQNPVPSRFPARHAEVMARCA